MKNFKQTIVKGSLLTCLVFAANSFALNYVDDAKNYYEKGEYKAAIIQLKNHLKENPDDAFTRYLLAKSYLKTGDITQADKEAGRARKLDRNNADITLIYAQILLAKRDFKKVQIVLSEKFDNPEKEGQRQIHIANAFLGQNQLGDAKQIFSELMLEYKNEQIFNGLAKIAILENEYDSAEKWLKQSINIAPENPDALQIKAKIKTNKKEYDEALIIYNQLIQTQEDNLALYLNRAAIKVQLKDFKSAEKDIQKILTMIENQPQANYLLAQIKLQEKNYVEAQVAAQNVLNIIPYHYDSMLILGVANAAQGNYNQADKYLTQHLTANPDNLSVQNVLANVYIAQKKGEQAVLILESIDENKKNNNAEILTTLGSAYLLTGEYQKGIDSLNKANELEPDSILIQKKLIEGKYRSGNIDGVISGLEKIVASEQNNTQTNYLLIISYLQKKDTEKAENKLKELIQETPDDPTLYNLKAVVQKLKGNNIKSKEAYNQALEINDKYIPAYIGLAELATEQNDWTSAKSYYLKVIQINKKHIKSYLYLASIAERQNQPQEIEKQLKIGMEQANEDVNLQIKIATLLSKFYIKQKTPEKIIPIAKELNKSYPNNMMVLSFLAGAQISNKQINEAQNTLREIIFNNKSDINHRILLVNLLIKQPEKSEEVIKLLDEVSVINPNNLKFMVLKCSYLVRLNKLDDAMQLAEQINNKFPDEFYGEKLKGGIYLIQEKYQLALTAYQAAYQLQPDEQLLFAIVDLMKLQNQGEKGIALLEAELEKNPKNVKIMNKLAVIYQMLKQDKKSIHYYGIILKEEPENVVALNNLAGIYLEKNNPEALVLAKKAYELSPDSASILDTYATVLIKNKQFRKGLDLQIEAAQKAPASFDIQYNLAYAYHLNNENEKAIEILEKITKSTGSFATNSFLNKNKAISLLNKLK